MLEKAMMKYSTMLCIFDLHNNRTKAHLQTEEARMLYRALYPEKEKTDDNFKHIKYQNVACSKVM